MIGTKHSFYSFLYSYSRIVIYVLFVSLISLFSMLLTPLSAQVVLSADGTTDTYNLINSVLAPNGNAVETPDCGHEDFGDHIDQVMDDVLNAYVFRFHIHVDDDNDRCKNYDRQRNEIKTYDKSPDNLLAIEGETVEYKWKFKLDNDFQTSSSFTHLHQVKAVGGSEDGMPLITLTARSTNKMQVRYAEHLNQETIHEVALSPFLGQWVEAIERIAFGEEGTYSIVIKRLSDDATILSYENNSLRMWKTDADFLRPKWGIYRSLNEWEDLRDEVLFFNDFSIEELGETALKVVRKDEFLIHPNPTDGVFSIDALPGATLDLYDMNGQMLYNMANVAIDEEFNLDLNQGAYLVHLTYADYTISQKLIVL